MVQLARPTEVDFLILGAGWTSTFLIPLLISENISYAATSTTGREGTIKFVFHPKSDDNEPFTRLPRAKTVLITFPLKGNGQSKRLLDFYSKTHAAMVTNWIQLGSTGIFSAPHWNDHASDYDKQNARAIAEDELLAIGGSVLNLAGLYGGTREPKNWVIRVAKSKEEVKGKKALHLIHGEDVARAIVATHRKFYGGERWLLTDLHVYDWWDLIYVWAEEVEKNNPDQGLQYRKWVLECMEEEKVRALPREKESLGRILDSREFWKAVGTWPQKGRVT
jgi:hypothetical protein